MDEAMDAEVQVEVVDSSLHGVGHDGSTEKDNFLTFMSDSNIPRSSRPHSQHREQIKSSNMTFNNSSTTNSEAGSFWRQYIRTSVHKNEENVQL